MMASDDDDDGHFDISDGHGSTTLLPRLGHKLKAFKVLQ